MESRAGVTACAVASATDPPPQQPPPQRPPHMRPGGVVPKHGRGPSGWTRHKLLISHHKGAYCSAQPGSRVFSRCWCGSEPQTQGWRPPGHRARIWDVSISKFQTQFHPSHKHRQAPSRGGEPRNTAGRGVDLGWGPERGQGTHISQSQPPRILGRRSATPPPRAGRTQP